LFEDALVLMEKGNAELACPKLEESQRLDPGVGTLLYLADCYETLGRTASAWATFLEATYTAKDAGQADREKIATENAERLKPTLSKLQLNVAGKDEPGLTVTDERRVVAVASFGSEVPVDPGDHEIMATQEHHAPWSTKVTVPKGPGVTVVDVPALELLVEAPVAAPLGHQPSAPPGPRDESARDAGKNQRLWGWIAVGGGAAALVGSGLFTLLAVTDNGRADAQCRQDDPVVCGEKGVDLAESAGRKANIASALGGAGIALGLTGGVLLFTAPSASDSGAAQIGVAVGSEPRLWLEQTW
jgi:serine/threonine-protein kinase